MRRVAIKRMPLHTTEDASGIPGLAEARTAAMLNHPNIVSVIDFETTATEALLIMEALEGPTLSNLIDETPQGRFDLDVLASVVQDVGSALDFAHENQVLHLDIKPDNILIAATGVTKVSDFGISELADAQGFGQACGGTIGYMPPEQMQLLDLDQRCDEFAFAVVIYEMLTGRSPFVAGSIDASLKLIERFDVELPSEARDDIDPTLDDIVLAGMSADREERFETIYDFIEALSPYLGDPEQGSFKLKQLLNDDEESDELIARRTLQAPDDLLEHFGPRTRAVAGRALAAVLSWLIAAAGLIAIPAINTQIALVAALLAAAVAAVHPRIGAAAALIIAGAGIIASPAVTPVLGIILIFLSIVWLAFAWDGDTADANCLLFVAPLGLIGLTPAAPLAFGRFTRPLHAGIGAIAAFILAFIAGIVTCTGSYLHFGTVIGAHADVGMNAVQTLATPAPWIIMISWAVSAVLVSFLCGRATRLSSELGIALGFVVLLVAQVAATGITTGAWALPEATVLASYAFGWLAMAAVCALGAPQLREGEE